MSIEDLTREMEERMSERIAVVHEEFLKSSTVRRNADGSITVVREQLPADKDIINITDIPLSAPALYDSDAIRAAAHALGYKRGEPVKYSITIYPPR